MTAFSFLVSSGFFFRDSTFSPTSIFLSRPVILLYVGRSRQVIECNVVIDVVLLETKLEILGTHLSQKLN